MSIDEWDFPLADDGSDLEGQSIPEDEDPLVADLIEETVYVTKASNMSEEPAYTAIGNDMKEEYIMVPNELGCDLVEMR